MHYKNLIDIFWYKVRAQVSTFGNPNRLLPMVETNSSKKTEQLVTITYHAQIIVERKKIYSHLKKE